MVVCSVLAGFTIGVMYGADLNYDGQPKRIPLWQADFSLVMNGCGEAKIHHAELSETVLYLRCGDGSMREFERK